MTDHKIKTMRDLEAEMRAVARGEHPAPADAAEPTFESAEALKASVGVEIDPLK